MATLPLPAVRCTCDEPALLLTTVKPGPNLDRQFYKCGQKEKPCSFFLWRDEHEKAVQAALKNNHRIDSFFKPLSTNPRPTPSGLTYVPDFITTTEEKLLMESIDKAEWDTSIVRPVQHYGWRYDYQKRTVSKENHLGPLPDWCTSIVERLQPRFPSPIDQLIVNGYYPGQGISAHIDQPLAFGPVVASVSLLSGIPMEFKHQETGQVVTVWLAPRSAVILTDDARYKWTHAIPARQRDDGRPRHRRVSLTFRTVVNHS